MVTKQELVHVVQLSSELILPLISLSNHGVALILLIHLVLIKLLLKTVLLNVSKLVQITTLVLVDVGHVTLLLFSKDSTVLTGKLVTLHL